MSSKTKIYNLALSALLLSREVIDADTDKSNEVKVLNQFYDIALDATLEDLDLDSTSQQVSLELLASLSDDDIPWDFVYKYPSNCAFLRRLVSGCEIDSRSTHVSKQVKLYEGQKAIYTNEQNAKAEYIPRDLVLSELNSMTILAIAQKLAYLSVPLLVGKGGKTLRKEVMEVYGMYKLEAQEIDKLENFNYYADQVHSEWVEARMS